MSSQNIELSIEYVRLDILCTIYTRNQHQLNSDKFTNSMNIKKELVNYYNEKCNNISEPLILYLEEIDKNKLKKDNTYNKVLNILILFNDIIKPLIIRIEQQQKEAKVRSTDILSRLKLQNANAAVNVAVNAAEAFVKACPTAPAIPAATKGGNKKKTKKK